MLLKDKWHHRHTNSTIWRLHSHLKPLEPKLPFTKYMSHLERKETKHPTQSTLFLLGGRLRNFTDNIRPPKLLMWRFCYKRVYLYKFQLLSSTTTNSQIGRNKRNKYSNDHQDEEHQPQMISAPTSIHPRVTLTLTWSLSSMENEANLWQSATRSIVLSASLEWISKALQ